MKHTSPKRSHSFIGGQSSLCLAALCGALAFGNTAALANEDGSQLNLLLRLQPELIHASGDRPDARGTDGWDISDGWAGSNTNSAGWGALFINGHHTVQSGLQVFATLGLNIDADGLKESGQNTRVAFAGVRGGWGQITAGRLEAPYKNAGLGWDPLNATFLQSRGNLGRSGGGFGHGADFNSAVEYAYRSDAIELRAMVALDERMAPGDSKNDHAWSVSAIAPLGPVELMFSHIDGSHYRGGAAKQVGTKVGLRYVNGPLAIASNYEWRDEGLEDGSFLFGSVSYRIEDWTVSFNAGHFSDDSSASNDGQYLALGAQYRLSQYFAIHTGLQYNDRDIGGDELVMGVGLRITLATGNLIR